MHREERKTLSEDESENQLVTDTPFTRNMVVEAKSYSPRKENGKEEDVPPPGRNLIRINNNNINNNTTNNNFNVNRLNPSAGNNYANVNTIRRVTPAHSYDDDNEVDDDDDDDASASGSNSSNPFRGNLTKEEFAQQWGELYRDFYLPKLSLTVSLKGASDPYIFEAEDNKDTDASSFSSVHPSPSSKKRESKHYRGETKEDAAAGEAAEMTPRKRPKYFIPSKEFVAMYAKVYQISTRGNGSERLYEVFSEALSASAKRKFLEFSEFISEDLPGGLGYLDTCPTAGTMPEVSHAIGSSAATALTVWMRIITDFAEFSQRVARVFSYLDRFYSVSKNLPLTNEQGRVQLLNHFVRPSLRLVARGVIEIVLRNNEGLIDIVGRDLSQLGMLYAEISQAVERKSPPLANKLVECLLQFQNLSQKTRLPSLLKDLGEELKGDLTWQKRLSAHLPPTHEQVCKFLQSHGLFKKVFPDDPQPGSQPRPHPMNENGSPQVSMPERKTSHTTAPATAAFIARVRYLGNRRRSRPNVTPLSGGVSWDEKFN